LSHLHKKCEDVDKYKSDDKKDILHVEAYDPNHNSFHFRDALEK